jgi:hypothetical protein
LSRDLWAGELEEYQEWRERCLNQHEKLKGA